MDFFKLWTHLFVHSASLRHVIFTSSNFATVQIRLLVLLVVFGVVKSIHVYHCFFILEVAFFFFFFLFRKPSILFTLAQAVFMCFFHLGRTKSRQCTVCNVSAYSGIIRFVPVLQHNKIAALEDSTVVQHQHVLFLPVHVCCSTISTLFKILLNTWAVFGSGCVRSGLRTTLHNVYKGTVSRTWLWRLGIEDTAIVNLSDRGDGKWLPLSVRVEGSLSPYFLLSSIWKSGSFKTAGSYVQAMKRYEMASLAESLDGTFREGRLCTSRIELSTLLF